jgi:transposase
MEPERIELSQRERDRLKVVHAVEQGHLSQVEAARRLQLSDRQVRRLLVRVRAEGDRGVLHRLRGRPSNRKIPARIRQRSLRRLQQPCYAGFGPTLAAEHLARAGIAVSRETLRGWMSQAGLWRPRRPKMAAVHVWRERRAAFGELVLLDTSAHAWLEERGPKLCLIAMIDDATSRLWARFTTHDTTEENLRTLEGWLRRYGRPLALYTDKDSIFQAAGPPAREEQLRGEPARTQFGRALAELDIEWIPAHSPQAKGRIERGFGTLQDRLIKELRVSGIDTREAANRFLERTFLPQWEQRFTVAPRCAQDAHRPLGREHRWQQILSVRVARTVAQDHTVQWQGQRWGVPREAVCAGLRGARVEIERRLDGRHWLRFRGGYLPLVACPAAPPRSASPSGLRPPGLAERKAKAKPKYIPPPDHPWRRPWKRTFLLGRQPDISTLR